MSLLSWLGIWRTLEVPDWDLDSSSRYKHVKVPKKNLCSKFQLPTSSFNMQRTLMSLLSLLGLWRSLEVLDWGSESSLRYKYVQLPQKNLYTKFHPPILSFKVQRTLMSLLSGLGLWRTLEVPDWSLKSSSRDKYVQLPKKNLCTKFQHPMLSFKVQRSSLKELLCPYWLNWVSGGHWRFLMGVSSLDHYFRLLIIHGSMYPEVFRKISHPVAKI